MNKQQLLKLLTLSLLLTACGSNSSSSNSDDQVGYLIDSAVGGVEYRSGEKVGITSSDGKFIYSVLPVSFYIGSTKLGSIYEIPKDEKVFPQDIVGVDRGRMEDDEVVKLATLLQSLDSDGDASNGITISSATRERFTTDVEILLEDIELDELKEMHPEIEFISEDDVVEHLSFSLDSELGVDREVDAISQEDGESDSSSTDQDSTSPLLTRYTQRVINNQGISVEGHIKNYTIRIYSKEAEVANSQSTHKGVVVKFDGDTSKSIAIQSSYLNKKIVIALYDTGGELITFSDEILVTDDAPVVIVEMSFK